MQEFDDIRSYHDEEVSGVLSSLLEDNDFLQFIAQQKFPFWQRFFPVFVKKRIQKYLQTQFKNLNSIGDVQDMLAPMIHNLLGKTITNFSVTGLGQLDAKTAYTFISNHRDISKDPLLVNFALHQAGIPTSQIAIGDNLIQRPFVGKLMRLNKSFLVKRSPSGRREKLAAVNQLSAYIHQTIQSGQSIWIAQKEGRAKDGRDFTDTAVLKMLHMAGRANDWDMKRSMTFLNIVPVSISYEWDPCDEDKARELDAIDQHGEYQKAEDEDFLSIVKGLKGKNGRVNVHFSEPIKLDSSQADHWSQAIDQDIHKHYCLFENNQHAHELLKQGDDALVKDDSLWHDKYAHLSKSIYKQIVKTYSQPVVLQTAANAPNDSE